VVRGGKALLAGDPKPDEALALLQVAAADAPALPVEAVAARRTASYSSSRCTRPVVTGGRRHGEQVVAVGALLPRDLGPALEHLTQAVGIVRLDGTVGAEERLTAARQPPDVAPQRRPAREAVRPRDDQSRTIRGERGPDAPKRRDGARRCVLGGCARPVGALCV